MRGEIYIYMLCSLRGRQRLHLHSREQLQLLYRVEFRLTMVYLISMNREMMYTVTNLRKSVGGQSWV